MNVPTLTQMQKNKKMFLDKTQQHLMKVGGLFHNLGATTVSTAALAATEDGTLFSLGEGLNFTTDCFCVY